MTPLTDIIRSIDKAIVLDIDTANTPVKLCTELILELDSEIYSRVLSYEKPNIQITTSSDEDDIAFR